MAIQQAVRQCKIQSLVVIMQMKQLANTGVMISEIGLGTWRYSGGSAPLRYGVELGANLIDTAEMYRTEDAVGAAIEGIRDRVFLATKVLGSNLRRDAVMRAADRSLRLLNVAKIDLYQIHWPNPSVPIAENYAGNGRPRFCRNGGLHRRQQFFSRRHGRGSVSSQE